MPVWKRLFFSALVLAAALVAVECALLSGLDRWLAPRAFADPYAEAKEGWWRLITYDPIVYWRGRPFARLPGTDEFLNARGFRGTDFRDEKPPHLRRVVCMGDSATFGLVSHGGVNFTYTPTYSSELQRLLNTDDVMQSVEVINAGIIGYATPQGLRLLKHEVRHWRPDVLVIRYGVNDHLRKSYDYQPAEEPRNVLLRMAEDRLVDLRLVQFMSRLKDTSRARALRGLRPKESKPPDQALPVRVPLDEFDYNLRRMVEEGRAAGAHVILATAPLAPLVPEITSDLATIAKLGFPNYDELLALHRDYEEAVRRVASDLGVALLDSSRDLPPRGLERFFTRYDLAHPNGDGHAAIAQDLAALIRSQGWLE